MKGTQFTLKHYAAEVVYDAVGFCFKNKDPVQPAIVEIMSASTSGYVRDMFKGHMTRMTEGGAGNTARRPGPGKGKGSTIIFESVTAQFKRQLADLMTRIHAAHPHFVRCINPNSKKEASKLEPEMILDQLRCSGLMEAVRVSRAGFPVRISHGDFIQRFTILIPPPPGAPKDVAKQMCVSLRVPAEHYRIGNTKVFMRREIHDKLEEERSRLLVHQALSIQKTVRGHLARNLVRKLRAQRKAAATDLQRQVRRVLVRRWYSDMLEKRQRLMAANGAGRGAGGGGPATPNKAPNGRAQRGGAPPGPPGPGALGAPPAGGAVRGAPSLIGTAGNANPKVVEELTLQLDSVRELYYNERASQMALSNLVREVQELRDPEAILRRIKVLQDKIQAQRQEAAAQKPSNIDSSDYEDGALARRCVRSRSRFLSRMRRFAGSDYHSHATHTLPPRPPSTLCCRPLHVYAAPSRCPTHPIHARRGIWSDAAPHNWQDRLADGGAGSARGQASPYKCCQHSAAGRHQSDPR